MTMSADSALINIGCTRQIIKKVKLSEWNKLSDSYKDCYRDSVRTYYNLPIETRVFVTNGKKFFYDFENVIPTISRGIEIFNNNNVDPFYAQAILLIESPNALQKSNVGAYGSFQIMKKVAVNLGLKVNKYEDERKDFDKSAWAAAKDTCAAPLVVAKFACVVAVAALVAASSAFALTLAPSADTCVPKVGSAALHG